MSSWRLWTSPRGANLGRPRPDRLYPGGCGDCRHRLWAHTGDGAESVVAIYATPGSMFGVGPDSGPFL